MVLVVCDRRPWLRMHKYHHKHWIIELSQRLLLGVDVRNNHFSAQNSPTDVVWCVGLAARGYQIYTEVGVDELCPLFVYVLQRYPRKCNVNPNLLIT